MYLSPWLWSLRMRLLSITQKLLAYEYGTQKLLNIVFDANETK